MIKILQGGLLLLLWNGKNLFFRSQVVLTVIFCPKKKGEHDSSPFF